MTTIQKYKGKINQNKNRNTRIVKIRENRRCKYCGELMTAGTECLTVNKKNEPRYWVCSGCVDTITNYREAKATLNDVSFGDEGGYMANQDWLAECEDECECIGYFSDDEDDWFGEE